MEYLVKSNISVQGGLKFRDPNLRLTSQHTSSTVTLGGKIVTFSQDKFGSRINVDGVTFTLCIYYDF